MKANTCISTKHR